MPRSLKKGPFVDDHLQKKVDVNATEADGTTALHWAVYRGDVETALTRYQSALDRYLEIDAIGVDEIQYANGHKYLTLVYQIDIGITRLLWVG